MSECPPGVVLERYLLGEIAGTASERWLEHLATCPRCAEQLQAMRADDQRYHSSSDAAALAARLAAEAPRTRPAHWAIRRGIGVAVALAAAVALIVLLSPGRGGDELRVKGGAGVLGVDRLHGDQLGAYGGEPLREGDALQLRWTALLRGNLAAIGIEANGEQSVLYPATPIDAGAQIDLGGRIVIERRLKRARICVLFSKQALSIDALVAAECRQKGDRVVAALDLEVE